MSSPVWTHGHVCPWDVWFILQNQTAKEKRETYFVRIVSLKLQDFIHMFLFSLWVQWHSLFLFLSLLSFHCLLQFLVLTFCMSVTVLPILFPSRDLLDFLVHFSILTYAVSRACGLLAVWCSSFSEPAVQVLVHPVGKCVLLLWAVSEMMWACVILSLRRMWLFRLIK